MRHPTIPFTLLPIFLLLLCAVPAWAAAGKGRAAAPVQPVSGTSMLDSVEAALAYNPELKASQERRQVTSHAVDKARAGFFPSIAVEAGAGFSQRNDAGTRAYKEWEKVRGYGDAGMRLIQPLFQGGYTTADVAARRAQFNAADSDLEDSGTSLTFQAIVAHVEVLRRSELVTLAKNNVKEHANILTTVRKRYSGQIATVGELHQVEGRHSRAKATLSAYESALDAAHASYLSATGKPARNLVGAPSPTKTYPGLDEAREICLAGNKRIQSAMHEVAMASGEKDMAKSRFYPSINLEAGPSWHNRDSYTNSMVSEMSVGLRLKWDLLSGGEDVANVAMAGARIRQARQNLHAIMDSLNRDIESTFSLYKSSLDQIGMYAEAKKSSRLARDDYYRQFISAQRSLLDVLDAENDYFYAAGQQVMCQGDRVIAGYRLLALSGDLLASLGLDPKRLRVNTPTTVENADNLRFAFPTPLRGK